MSDHGIKHAGANEITAEHKKDDHCLVAKASQGIDHLVHQGRIGNIGIIDEEKSTNVSDHYSQSRNPPDQIQMG